MFTNIKRLILLLLVFLVSYTSYSQYRSAYSRKFVEGLSITPKAGINIFYGDLVDKSRSSYSLGVSADREMHQLFTLRTQLIGGGMKGIQMYQLTGYEHLKFASFTNNYVEWTIGGTFRPLNAILGYFKERTIQPYVLLQGGPIFYNAKEYRELDEYINYFGTKLWRSESGISFVFGVGGGTTIWLNPRVKLNLEFYGSFATTDLLDAHKEWSMLPDLSIVYQTADKDFYYTATFGITYLINDSKFRNDFNFNKKTYTKNKAFFSRKTSKSASYKRRRW